ncbi:hypothetical protein [Bradyrhizobium erythrophlei]|uniref:Uncharacterized protein n=1 Tax=Bradyrhizobium erythrophlei TaxID=1437360 RepID=A0A1M5HJD1_9BRAD|nr:hypothetical protein [Bradyrhizobium erythrophlei]SHG16008.1 hypothetical protein SAMN05444169_0857 [Bradyrhizobium erythrophlei]
MVKHLHKRSDSETKQTGRDARRSVLPIRPAIRMVRRHYFDANNGSLISDGVVEVCRDVRLGEGFVCKRDKRLYPIKRGCGRDCACLQCDAEPRRDSRPPKATVQTCPCVKCQLRRERRQ